MPKFVWHLRGSIRLDSAHTNDVVLMRLERLLAQQQKTVVEHTYSILAFDNPLWRDLAGGNWRAMVIYDSGRFWIEERLNERRLRYDLRSLHGLVWCLFLASIACLFGLLVGGIIVGAKFAIGAFVWLYGMNILLAVIRVPLAVRRAVCRT
ncbi:hypothetical protein [Aquisediminimonas profunda]|uniref:hypothetical protein n=1 Tax=Aquisediminimonas profunda TaxID=1550733 RepID=UPI001C63328F|nr:hypothetical protein [Aquisediminimonas profunda]